MRQSPLVLGATVLTLGILSAAPAGRATDSEAGASGNMKGEPAAPGEAAVLNLSPFRLNQNLALGAVSESSDEDAEADKLAKQLSNPVASLISVPFQANEDWGYGPSGKGYKFTLNIQPVIPISISENWNLILRTIVPIVSQHDLFFVPDLPKNSRCNPRTVRRMV